MFQEYLLIINGLIDKSEPFIEDVSEAYDRINICKAKKDNLLHLNEYLKNQIQNYKNKQNIKDEKTHKTTDKTDKLINVEVSAVGEFDQDDVSKSEQKQKIGESINGSLFTRLFPTIRVCFHILK